VTELSDRVAEPDRGQISPGEVSQRLIGTLVHRLFQRDLQEGMTHEALAGLARDLLRDEDLVDVLDIHDLCSRAAATYERLRDRSDLRTLLASGQRFYEVGFSWMPDPGSRRVVRGIVDCLVLDPAGGATIVEIKTGVPRPEHRSQAEAYAAAAAAALKFPNISVKIVYPSADVVR
jgi:RecB family exonuclease